MTYSIKNLVYKVPEVETSSLPEAERSGDSASV